MQRIGWHPLSRKVLVVCLMFGACLMLMACGGESSEANKPAIAWPIPHEAQAVAVAEEIFPEAHPGVYGHCSLHLMDVGCPMTLRLQDRLLDAKVSICRCQNGSGTRKIEVERYEGGAVAHVTMYEGHATYDLIMVLDDDGVLLVDDQTCNGDPKTSIYNDPLGPC